MAPFWDFSVRTYRTESVPGACLFLQNDHGVDVNMLLYCAWVGAFAGCFDDDLYQRASDYSGAWAGKVVIPLRQVRTWMKHTGCKRDPDSAGECERLRDDIKGVEFAAEKMQQEVLQSFLAVTNHRNANIGSQVADVAANMLRYLGDLSVQPTAEVRQKLTVIIRAALPGADQDLIDSALVQTTEPM